MTNHHSPLCNVRLISFPLNNAIFVVISSDMSYLNLSSSIPRRLVISIKNTSKLVIVPYRIAYSLPPSAKMQIPSFYDPSPCRSIPFFNVPPYWSCTPYGSFVSLRSQNSSQGLAKLQVFASHPPSPSLAGLKPAKLPLYKNRNRSNRRGVCRAIEIMTFLLFELDLRLPSAFLRRCLFWHTGN